LTTKTTNITYELNQGDFSRKVDFVNDAQLISYKMTNVFFMEKKHCEIKRMNIDDVRFLCNNNNRSCGSVQDEERRKVTKEK
jgi:hypothetical protein